MKDLLRSVFTKGQPEASVEGAELSVKEKEVLALLKLSRGGATTPELFSWMLLRRDRVMAQTCIDQEIVLPDETRALVAGLIDKGLVAGEGFKLAPEIKINRLTLTGERVVRHVVRIR